MIALFVVIILLCFVAWTLFKFYDCALLAENENFWKKYDKRRHTRLLEKYMDKERAECQQEKEHYRYLL